MARDSLQVTLVLGHRIGPLYGAFFRWYWQANLASFIWHHLFGYQCNTWKFNEKETV